MTRPVRLIGGVCDGQIRNVDPDQDYLTASEAMPLPILPKRGSLAAQSFKAVRYTRREVSMPAGIITFFAIDKMSDFEALQHVLGP